MDFYTNAQETEQTAICMLEACRYRHSIYMSCLAVELYLKSKLHLVPHRDNLETSHNIVSMYNALVLRYPSKKDLLPMIDLCRKYFNESRYPYAGDNSVYTENFTKEFIKIVCAVKDYIDNECVATIDDLKNKYDGETST